MSATLAATPTEQTSLWSKFLAALPKPEIAPPSSLVILGNPAADVAPILRALQEQGGGSDLYGDNQGISALDFAFLNVRGPEEVDQSEAQGKVSVWIVQHPSHRELAKRTIPSSSAERMVVMICLDLEEPWAILRQLSTWLEVARDLISHFLSSLSADQQNSLRDNVESHFREVRAATAESEGTTATNDDLLAFNGGVPIVVCVGKSEMLAALDAKDRRGQAELVTAHLRNACLPYGAALLYCSAGDKLSNRNIDVLYRYLLHRLYQYEFRAETDITEREGLFVPGGWDSESKVREFAKKTIAGGLEKPLETIVTMSTEKAALADELVVEVEDMNSFLSQHPTAALPTTSRRTVRDRDERTEKPPAVKTTAAREAAPPSTTRSARTGEPNPPPTSRDPKLRNLFQNLMRNPAGKTQASGESNLSGTLQPSPQTSTEGAAPAAGASRLQPSPQTSNEGAAPVRANTPAGRMQASPQGSTEGAGVARAQPSPQGSAEGAGAGRMSPSPQGSAEGARPAAGKPTSQGSHEGIRPTLTGAGRMQPSPQGSSEGIRPAPVQAGSGRMQPSPQGSTDTAGVVRMPPSPLGSTEGAAGAGRRSDSREVVRGEGSRRLSNTRGSLQGRTRQTPPATPTQKEE